MCDYYSLASESEESEPSVVPLPFPLLIVPTDGVATLIAHLWS